MKHLLVERASSALADVDTAGWTLRFDLLSDPNRLEILLCLHRAPGICVGDLAEALGEFNPGRPRGQLPARGRDRARAVAPNRRPARLKTVH